MTRALRIVALGALVAACSAEVDVVELPSVPDGQSHHTIDGLPFRMHERYEIAVWQRQTDGSFERVHQERKTLPDQERLYVLRYWGMPLSSATAKVQMQSDGTLKTVELSDVDTEVPEALSETAAQLTATETARTTRETAEATEAAAGRAAQLDFYTAKKEALAQEAYVSGLAPDDPNRLAQELELKLRKIKANLAAAAAGEKPPFPGVSL